MSHYFSAHSKELNFFVKCGVNDCPGTFRRYHSFYKHVARNHKDEYQSNIGGPADILGDINATTNGDIQHMDQDLDHVDQNTENFDLDAHETESDETSGDSDSSLDSRDYDLYEAPNTNGEVSKW